MLNQANISYSKISLKPQKMTDKTVVLISHLMVELKATKTHTQIFKVNRR